jgi:hypothetical protein
MRFALSALGPADDALASKTAFLRTAGARIVVQHLDARRKWVLSDHERTQLAADLDRVAAGEISPAQALALGQRLGQAFATLPAAGPDDAVELCSEQRWLLTDLPWEFARQGTTAGDERALGERPLLRVPTVVGDRPLSPRPTVLVAIARLASAPGRIHPAQYVPGLTNELRASPPFQVVAELGTEEEQPLFIGGLEEAARRCDPDVLVLVAHGKAGPATVFFADHEAATPGDFHGVPVAELALMLGSPRLVILLCCDITREAGGPSGALSFIDAGVPEAITMQGEIPQDAAARFVKGALLRLHRRGGLAEAVRAGREAVGASPHALIPVGFSTLGAQASTARWESARKAYDIALQTLLPPPVAAPGRPGLSARIAQWLAAPGCRIVEAPYDPTGRTVAAPFATYLAAQASNRLLEPRRPALILDYDAPLQAEADATAAPWDRLFDRLAAALARAQPVLPRGTVPAARAGDRDAQEAAGQLVDIIDEAGIALLVLRAHTTAASGGFWQEVARIGSSALRRGTLLIGPRPDAATSLEALFPAAPVVIPPLTTGEIKELFQGTDMSMSLHRLRSVTGGNPFLLHAARAAQAAGRGIPVEELVAIQAQAVADAVAVLSLNAIDGRLRPALGLCFVNEPASAQALAQLIPEIALGPLARLASIGVLGSITDADAELFYAVPELARALRRHIEQRQPDALGGLAAALFERLPDPDAVRSVMARPGGLAALAAVQRILDTHAAQDDAALAHAQRAFEIGWWASLAEPVAPRGSRRVLLEMLKVSRRVYETHSDPSPDLLYEMARVAHAVGEEEAADEALAALGRLGEVPVELQIRREWLAADQLKDLAQASGADKALAHLDRAEALLDTGDAGLEQQERDALASDIHYTRTKILAFLGGRSVDDLPPAPRGTAERPASHLSHALTLCTFAEQEMRQDAPDWTRVAVWLGEAESALYDERGSPGLRAYCAYQMAQAKRRGPQPDVTGAIELYRLAERLAQEAGDHARRGLAACRIAQLLVARSGTDRGELAATDAAMAESIDELTRAGGAVPPRHAFSARALVRLHRMRAEIAGSSENKSRHYRSAALTSRAPVLASTTDLRLLAASCADFLAISLNSPGTYLAVRRFIVDMDMVLRQRLELTVERDNPDALLTDLRAWRPAVAGG